jgi:RimJ/RimL family protein N-acetyltransferase
MDFTRDIELETDLVRLEPLSDRYYAEFEAIALQQPDLIQYSPFPFGTVEATQLYFEDASEGRKKEFRYPFAILEKKTGRFVGSTSFGYVSVKDRRLEIGWTWIDRQLHGSDLNRHCKFLLLRYTFESLDFERVEFRTDARNMRSQKAMEKIGATYEGELRSHTVMPDGFRRNTRFYGILKSEWPKIRATIFHDL